jgi:hypothetical protein
MNHMERAMTENDQSEYEAGLRWRSEVLKAKLEAGEIVIADHLAEDFEKSLKAVKYQADGQIDLSTVDGRIPTMVFRRPTWRRGNHWKYCRFHAICGRY